ncbi:MAG: NTP transferase domain-containing protein, partial [Candidatus Omnitrophica bacterium]|nr:NTP transferase domain-containing protein [Candidatus Omnitrophota bacterium]
MKTIGIIPARGGSKGIPRKNLRDLNGKPLIAYTIGTALKAGCFDRIVVSTEDEEIAHIAREFGAEVHIRPDHLAADQTTLDPVIFDAVQAVRDSYDIVATLQPTCPLLKPETLKAAHRKMMEDKSIDTLLSAVNDPRLAWIEVDSEIVPAYEKRVNRQELPPYFRETGAFFFSRRKWVTESSRFGKKVAVFEIPENEALDIDTMKDWWIAERTLQSRRIAFRVDGNRKIGFGHVYRQLLLANRLLDHDLRFFLDEAHDSAIEVIRGAFYPLEFGKREEIQGRILDYQPDILINDILDTTPDEVLPFKEKGIFVVNFEDLGTGMPEADLVINALYESDLPYSHVYTGPDYYCLRDEFAHTRPRDLSEKLNHLLITFGGADPSNLTHKSIRALGGWIANRAIRTKVILGLGYPEEWESPLREEIANRKVTDLVSIFRNVKSMAAEFKWADLALTSYGRTMYEIASMGVPAILMGQNQRELQHAFGHSKNGFASLGLGEKVTDDQLLATVKSIDANPKLRVEMRNRMAETDLGGGAYRVTQLILNAYRESNL